MLSMHMSVADLLSWDWMIIYSLSRQDSSSVEESYDIYKKLRLYFFLFNAFSHFYFSNWAFFKTCMSLLSALALFSLSYTGVSPFRKSSTVAFLNGWSQLSQYSLPSPPSKTYFALHTAFSSSNNQNRSRSSLFENRI